MNWKESHRQEYLKNLRAEKWVVVWGWENGNCEYPVEAGLTCGKYEGAVLIVLANGKLIKVPDGYCQRSKLWICPTHISDFDVELFDKRGKNERDHTN